jgi:hypothetical protein
MKIPRGSAQEKAVATIAALLGTSILFSFRVSLHTGPGWNHFLGFVLGCLLAQIVLVLRYRPAGSDLPTIQPRGIAFLSLSAVLLAALVDVGWFMVFRASLPHLPDVAATLVWAVSTFLIWAGVRVWMADRPHYIQPD